MDYFLNEYSLRGQFKDTDEFYDSLREYTLPVLKKIEKEKYCVIWKKDDLWNQNVCENLSMLDVLHMKERGRTEITVLKSLTANTYRLCSTRPNVRKNSFRNYQTIYPVH